MQRVVSRVQALGDVLEGRAEEVLNTTLGFAQTLLERAEHVGKLVAPFNRPATSSRIDEHLAEVCADVTVSRLNTVCSSRPLLLNRVGRSAELLHHALGEGINGLVSVDLVFRDHRLDFGG